MPGDGEVDFSLLPDVVWVSILKHLTFSERSCVSQTCHALRSAFHHPSLWSKVEVVLSSTPDQPPDATLIPHDRIACLAENYGHLIKHLTLVYLSFEPVIPQSCLALLKSLRTKCAPLSLTLDFDTPVRIGRSQEVQPLLDLLRTYDRLQSLSLRSWPAYDSSDCQRVMSTIAENSRTRKLEKLALFWERAEDATWVSLHTVTPEPTQVQELVVCLPWLQELSLRSTMLSEEVLSSLLASSAPLKRLGVLVTYKRNEADRHLPSIYAETWRALRQRCPKLLVDLTIVTRIPGVALDLFLQDDIPLGGIAYMRYASLSTNHLQYLTAKFSKTLQKFLCYAQPEGIDQQLFCLVKASPQLTSFVYHGSIHHRTVTNIARTREAKWLRFEVLEKWVDTLNLPQEDEDDDDTIIKRSETGEVVFAKQRIIPHQEEEERRNILEDVERTVSQAIGYHWTFRDSQSLHRRMTGVHMWSAPNQPSPVVESTPTRYLIAKGWPWIRS